MSWFIGHIRIYRIAKRMQSPDKKIRVFFIFHERGGQWLEKKKEKKRIKINKCISSNILSIIPVSLVNKKKSLSLLIYLYPIHHFLMHCIIIHYNKADLSLSIYLRASGGTQSAGNRYEFESRLILNSLSGVLDLCDNREPDDFAG